jgi:hypothetical protein
VRAAVLAVALGLVPALALAANPARNSEFHWCQAEDVCPFSFETSKDGRYVKRIRAYNDCNQVPAPYPRLRVRKGQFAKSGTVTNIIGEKVTYTIVGRFKTPKRAVGTYDVDGKDCKAKPRRFTARRIGRADAGF